MEKRKLKGNVKKENKLVCETQIKGQRTGCERHRHPLIQEAHTPPVGQVAPALFTWGGIPANIFGLEPDYFLHGTYFANHVFLHMP